MSTGESFVPPDVSGPEDEVEPCVVPCGIFFGLPTICRIEMVISVDWAVVNLEG